MGVVVTSIIYSLFSTILTVALGFDRSAVAQSAF